MNNIFKNWIEYITKNSRSNSLRSNTEVKFVANKCRLLNFSIPIIVVGGTNGKGTCVEIIKRIYINSGYNVGTFTSPFLCNIKEQIQFNDKIYSDQMYIDCFSKIHSIDKNYSLKLSLFEYLLLSALMFFSKNLPDILIFEIGMGGDTDAVNILNPEISILTNISIEHSNILGSTVEDIAAIKSKICRTNKPIIFGGNIVPKSLIKTVKIRKSLLLLHNINFHIIKNKKNWNWSFKNHLIKNIEIKNKFIMSVSISLMAIHLLMKVLPVKKYSIRKSIKNISIQGRYQKIKINANSPTIILDVAHNPASCKFLSTNLLTDYNNIEFKALFSMYSDKDIKKSLFFFKNIVKEWHILKINNERGESIKTIKNIIKDINKDIESKPLIISHRTFRSAIKILLKNSSKDDIIIVFGSFSVVGKIIKEIESLYLKESIVTK